MKNYIDNDNGAGMLAFGVIPKEVIMIDIAGQEIKVDDFVVNPAHGRDFKLSMNKSLGNE